MVCRKLQIKLKRFIHEGKDQHKSFSALHGEPLLYPNLSSMCNFLVIFLGWVMLPHPQTTSPDHGGSRTSDLPIERLKRNLVTPVCYLFMCCFSLQELVKSEQQQCQHVYERISKRTRGEKYSSFAKSIPSLFTHLLRKRVVASFERLHAVYVKDIEFDFSQMVFRATDQLGFQVR